MLVCLLLPVEVESELRQVALVRSQFVQIQPGYIAVLNEL